ncbi:LysR family transcriptional regulator [Noviherbaspirillum galbum]|uniref:LysR family transcriptional regulator n=1 Tax=Noviherbaspirillum galbum TaxID=2709383 RepID=A0A6B3SNT9_9BURK|nr:LysR family transcriptional regulator [Noviherbaspirillum galbum]NEX62178.1 LysR family transcriptional regulator [Noviherbaspirillum galbum]
MPAKMQYRLTPSDLETVLALVRGGTLAAAGERLGVDSSTVFRNLQRIERGTGQALFERTRTGYLAGDMALELARHGERLESEIEAARSLLQVAPEQVSGQVSITTTDTILHGLVAPAMGSLHALHPQLQFDLHAGNQPLNLTRRDADIAVRATRKPPGHLVGRHLGPIRVALYAPRKSRIRSLDEAGAGSVPWIAPDDALPDHPSVVWRRKHLPKIAPTYRVDSILSATECVSRGLGVALLPMFLADPHPGLKRVSPEIAECTTELWLLAHPESRHLRRIATVLHHLAEHVRLE